MNKRIKRLQEVLLQARLDAAIYATSSNLQYLLDDTVFEWQRTMYNGGNTIGEPDAHTGHFLNIPDCILLIPASGEPTLVMSRQRAKDMMHLDIHKEVCFFTQINEVVRAHLSGSRIAFGESCSWYLRDMLAEILPHAEAVPGETLVQELRMIKEEKEIDALRAVAAFTDQSMCNMADWLRPGVSQTQVQFRLGQYALDAGLDLSFPPAALFVKTGAPGAEVLFSHDPDAPLTPGTSVGYDFGYLMNGYVSDYGRSLYCGQAPTAIEDGYKALQEAQCRLIELIEPGMPLSICFKTLEDGMNRTGYGSYLRRHGDLKILGHQIGIDVHERPWIHDEQTAVFLPGMVMCIEPKLWWPGQCYLRCEDMVLIRETGAEFLTNFDRTRFSLPID